MPLVLTMSLKTFMARASPICANWPASQSESSCSIPSLPFHFRALEDLLGAVRTGIAGHVHGGGPLLHLRRARSRDRGRREARGQHVSQCRHDSVSFCSRLPFRKRSLQSFSHLSFSSSVIT